MPPLSLDFLDNPRGRGGGLGDREIWWAEHQVALEHAGYMLRPRYRPGWQPSWVGTGKFHRDFEDGRGRLVSTDTFSLSACAHELSAACVYGCNSDI
jgi:hypothetical protein